jgi:hypothetical protein
VDLRCVNVEVLAAVGGHDTVVIHETTADLEEDFDSVNEKEDDDDKQENGVASVEDAVKCILVAEELCGENL